MTESTEQSTPPDKNETRHRVDGLARAIVNALNSIQRVVEQNPEQLIAPEKEQFQQLPRNLKDRLDRLHTQWDIGRGILPEGNPSPLPGEDWFKRLGELNALWDVRSRIEDTQLSEDSRQEVTEHYPAILEQFLGISPTPHDSAQPGPGPLRERMAADLQRLHENWQFDREENTGPDDCPSSQTSGLRTKIKNMCKRIVRIHTDKPFQRQRDYNAWLVATLDNLVTQNSLFEQRITRILLEMTNRQFHFNLTLVRFVNTLMQEIILKRQREFNAEIVQTVQDILIQLPSLVLERTEILIERLEANLAALTIALGEKHARKE